MRKLFLILTLLSALVLMWAAYTPSPRESDNWEMMNPMATGRSEIAAALKGDDIYIAGGIGFFKALKSCEIYHIPKDRWSKCPDLPLPLHHVALASNGEHVFAAGGYSGLNFGFHMDAKLWRLEGDGWQVESALTEPIGEHAMMAYDGALYIIGGRTPGGDSAKLRKYDTVAKSWSQLAPLPVARHSFAPFIMDGELWVTGGRSAALGTRINRIDIYNFAEDKWRQGPDMPTGRGGHAAATLDGKVHILGGEVFGPTKLVDAHNIYNPEAKSWSDGQLMPASRHGMVAVTYNDQILIFGGGAKPAFQTIFSASPSVQRYAPNHSEAKARD